MQISYSVHSLTNRKGYPNEDRHVVPLGDFLNRVEAARTPAEEAHWEARIRERVARGLVFAVVDGVGSAPRGRAAAQVTADCLLGLYTNTPAPPATYATIRALLEEANATVHGWGEMKPGEATPGLSTGRSLGAAAVTVAYFSPQRNVTVLHAGDTTAFRYRPGSPGVVRPLTAADTLGAGISAFVGQGTAFAPLVVQVDDFREGDTIVLVTDGVVPKGMHEDGVLRALEDLEGDPERAAQEITHRARALGSVDDITAVVARLESWE